MKNKNALLLLFAGTVQLALADEIAVHFRNENNQIYDEVATPRYADGGDHAQNPKFNALTESDILSARTNAYTVVPRHNFERDEYLDGEESRVNGITYTAEHALLERRKANRSQHQQYTQQAVLEAEAREFERRYRYAPVDGQYYYENSAPAYVGQVVGGLVTGIAIGAAIHNIGHAAHEFHPAGHLHPP